jgi:hypothetical protein
MQMKGSPSPTTVGIFSVQPGSTSQRNALVIKDRNKIDRSKQDMEVQRADIPDLIAALQAAYFEPS